MGRVSVVYPRGRGILRKEWIQVGDYGGWKSVPSYEVESSKQISKAILNALRSSGFSGTLSKWDFYSPAEQAKLRGTYSTAGMKYPEGKYARSLQQQYKSLQEKKPITHWVNMYWNVMSPSTRQEFIFSKIEAVGYRKLEDREYNFISHNWGYLEKPQRRLVIRETGRWQVEGIAKTHALKQIMKRAKIVEQKVKPKEVKKPKPKPIMLREKKAIIKAKVSYKPPAKLPTKKPTKLVTKFPVKKPVFHPRPKHYPLHKK
ncbi:hypothetical protein KAW18_01425 [candidate division WOR-3 bacterium]|nr:hypothetical protein [candidate division WOR-3 bacterium]